MSVIDIPVAFGAKQANHTGAMLALYPSISVAKKIAIPNGELPEDLHVTLLYFGNASNLTESDIYRIQSAAQLVADKYAPFTAEIGGTGRFYTPDEEGNHAFYGSVDSPVLPELRHDLASGLKDLFANNHGFTPHMTLAYVKDGKPNPISSWQPTKIRFGALHLLLAGIDKEYPFTGES